MLRTKDAEAYWDARESLWRNYFGRSTYCVTDAGYFWYRDGVMLEHLNTWLNESGLTAPGMILDYGCGVGDTVFYLARRFPESMVFGVDLSGFMIRQAARRSDQAAGKTPVFSKIESVTDVPQLLQGKAIDLAVSSLVLQHNDDVGVREILGTLRGLLTTSGHALIMESVAPDEHRGETFVGRSPGIYEAIFTDCGLEVERDFWLNSPVYSVLAPPAKKLAAKLTAALGLSKRRAMQLTDLFCTPAVLGTRLTDGVLGKSGGWGYKLWWLKPSARASGYKSTA
jgi:SAM-dependent methyltransferase